MESLMLGLTAALVWGIHDFTVRRVTSAADSAALYLLVLCFGVLWILPFAAFSSGWSALTPQLTGFTILAGLVYGFGVYSLYRAFAIGPVRLVAPICGAYPLLSVGLAMVQGREITGLIWLAAVAVLGGVALVARGEGGDTQGSRRAAILWSMSAATGFFASLGMLHSAAEQAADLPVALIARLAGCLGILALVLWKSVAVRPALKVWPTLAMMAALDLGGMFAVTAAGSFDRPEFASVTSSCFGLVTVLLAWRFLAEPVRPAQWVGIAVVFAGVAVLSSQG
ncbi:MAG: DMT family transporter [Tabrizicola sp.]|nr:DMT family transporter [Tabrizicola sp.]